MTLRSAAHPAYVLHCLDQLRDLKSDPVGSDRAVSTTEAVASCLLSVVSCRFAELMTEN